MDPITQLRRFWDMWDLRILVLLSLTLQIILSLFGNRRKYISSMWISVLVWSAYLTADWVTTFALSKLSYTQGDGEKSNELWAIWAPLLLLHLGGPDSITAYSLEDNQLWVRHLLGLVVHISVAIYVIIMSWKNSWFSFMSLPALVAGVIKYGERTRVLKLVSDNNDEYLDVPFHRDSRYYSTGGDHDYGRLLAVAHEYLHEFTGYLLSEGDHVNMLGNPIHEANILRDALEVKMGLMYDLLYTKAALIYTKVGFNMRCISFGCTVTVLVGYILRLVHFKLGEEDDAIDIVITGVLIVGALALEFYAAIVILSSNWMMLWLIKHGRTDWVKWLSDQFPWLFNKGKNWSQMMGQFDLLGYYRKLAEPDVRSPIRKMLIRWVLGRYEDKWDRHQHTTSYSVHPLIYNAILDLCDPHDKLLDPNIDQRILSDTDTSTRCELDEIWAMVGHDLDRSGTFVWLVMCVHLATEICYREDNPSGSDSSWWKQNRKVSKVLSDYMMYLLLMHPSLLPNVGSLRWLEKDLHILKLQLAGGRHGPHDVDMACRRLLGPNFYHWSRIVQHLKGKGKPRKWEIIKQMWLRTLLAATRGEKGYDQKNSHFQHLRQGGELLTLIWFLNPPTRQIPTTVPGWNPSSGLRRMGEWPLTGCYIM